MARKPRRFFGSAIFRIAVLLAIFAGAGYGMLLYMTSMPGATVRPEVATLETPELEERLRRHVEVLASDIGIRHDEKPAALERAVDYIHEQMQPVGSVRRLGFIHDEMTFINLDVTLPGSSRPDEVIVVGAHYDTARGTPGANDNASGVAAMLELARHPRLQTGRARTIRFVAFANEEPPHFKTRHMGSLVYARDCQKNEIDVVAMLSLETMGYFSDEPGSQRYPWPLSSFYPSTGDFIALVGNVGSRSLVRRVVRTFRESSDFPCEGGAFPSLLPGVGWSDHWSFWKAGYSAVMVTDTAPFRYPWYHTAKDTPDQLDYERLAQVVDGLSFVLLELAAEPGS